MQAMTAPDASFDLCHDVDCSRLVMCIREIVALMCRKSDLMSPFFILRFSSYFSTSLVSLANFLSFDSIFQRFAYAYADVCAGE
jgi:hypothetical protein